MLGPFGPFIDPIEFRFGLSKGPFTDVFFLFLKQILGKSWIMSCEFIQLRCHLWLWTSNCTPNFNVMQL